MELVGVAERYAICHCRSGINVVSFQEWMIEIDECCLQLMDGFSRCMTEKF